MKKEKEKPPPTTFIFRLSLLSFSPSHRYDGFHRHQPQTFQSSATVIVEQRSPATTDKQSQPWVATIDLGFSRFQLFDVCILIESCRIGFRFLYIPIVSAHLSICKGWILSSFMFLDFDLKRGEINDEPQATVPLVPPSSEKSPPSAATEPLVEPKKESIMCNSLVEVQPTSELVAIETKRTMSIFEEEMLGVLKTIAEKLNKPEPPTKPTFEDCEKKLNELGWPKDDPLHLVALTIFCDENVNYRELWMKLDPNLCTDWVRMGVVKDSLNCLMN
ncbi:unnamed protein product [Lactuca virosa]|uniref:Uncharacterized protein n=1 Tax=Lactuca virosa TaxID=75947 RepID=A0AAU9PGG0_9ASTR|nr:unnamed protein product [Lactuca virosa]